MSKKNLLPESKAGIAKKMQRVITVTFSYAQMLRANEDGLVYNGQQLYFDDHREFVAHLFRVQGYEVIKFTELKYFWTNPGKLKTGEFDKVICDVQGVAGIALLSR